MRYTDEELRGMGMTFGQDVNIHRSAILLNPRQIVLGDHVRIDCFSVISAGSAGISIGRYVHLGAGVYLFGGGGPISISDFAGFSARVSVYTASDDYSDGFLTNPTVPDKFRRLETGGVTIGRHAIVGAGSIIMPGVNVGLGAAVGALTLVRKNVAEFQIIAGNPPRSVGVRNRRLLELETELLKDETRM